MIAQPGTRHVFLRDMVLQANIGWYPHEHGATQRVRINVDLGVDEGADTSDALDRVVSYETIANAVRTIAGAGHIKLVETLAERIAAACLTDPRVSLASVQVEKLDVFPDAQAAGVAVVRRRAVPPGLILSTGTKHS
ncbi:MAG: dihydroneopterin aldolase [Gemmatimonadaceae bacterium]|nr:dihydroneopterin aldolase [Acetobacteraceae bacterium]